MKPGRGMKGLPEGPITGDQFAKLKEPRFAELVTGKVVPVSEPTFEHGFLQMCLGAALFRFVADRNLGWVSGPTGVYTQRRPDTVRGPDAVVVSRAKYPKPPSRPRGYEEFVPDLIVEVLSSSDRWARIQQKIVEYQRIGVDCLWLVDPKHRNVTVYRGDRIARYGEGDTLKGDGVLEGFSLPLKELFTP